MSDRNTDLTAPTPWPSSCQRPVLIFLQGDGVKTAPVGIEGRGISLRNTFKVCALSIPPRMGRSHTGNGNPSEGSNLKRGGGIISIAIGGTVCQFAAMATGSVGNGESSVAFVCQAPPPAGAALELVIPGNQRVGAFGSITPSQSLAMTTSRSLPTVRASPAGLPGRVSAPGPPAIPGRVRRWWCSRPGRCRRGWL